MGTWKSVNTSPASQQGLPADETSALMRAATVPPRSVRSNRNAASAAANSRTLTISRRCEPGPDLLLLRAMNGLPALVDGSGRDGKAFHGQVEIGSRGD